MSITFEQLTNKVRAIFIKKEKRTGLLLTVIFELNQMTSDKIIVERVDFEVKLFIDFMKISW